MTETRRYKYLELLINIFVVVLIVSNLIAPKPVDVGWMTFSAAQLLFPITYIFGDIFTGGWRVQCFAAGDLGRVYGQRDYGDVRDVCDLVAAGGELP